MAKKQKLTPWFHSDKANPSRPGVYIATVSRNERFYRRWDGRTWHYGGFTVAYAASVELPWNSLSHPLHWRGLAEKPE